MNFYLQIQDKYATKMQEEEEEEQILLSQIKLHNYYYSNHNI